MDPKRTSEDIVAAAAGAALEEGNGQQRGGDEGDGEEQSPVPWYEEPQKHWTIEDFFPPYIGVDVGDQADSGDIDVGVGATGAAAAVQEEQATTAQTDDHRLASGDAPKLLTKKIGAAASGGIANREEDSASDRAATVETEANTSDADECNHASDVVHGPDSGFIYRAVHRNKRCLSCLLAWPRFFSLLYGVFLPMFFLIFLSYLCGYWLAKYEAPNEIENNNKYLRDYSTGKEFVETVKKVTKSLPRLCFDMYFNGTADSIKQVIMESKMGIINEVAAPEIPELVAEVNTTDLSMWITNCSSYAEQLVREIFGELEEVNTCIGLTFNWIRCYPSANYRSSGLLVHQPPPNITFLRPESQEKYYSSVWQADQQLLYQQYVDYLTANTNLSTANISSKALQMSFEEANGGSHCELNGPAAGWFWFTVLSTIGYGSTVPVTIDGQAMVYTIGFLTILAFGSILSTAGYIISGCFDDILVRFSLRWCTTPWISCIIWGFFYYGWMALIGLYAVKWKHDRLDMYEFDFYDGLWFSYISSTTIGFGDIKLQPSVFLFQDLFTFPLLFLIAFVFVAAFLGKLTEACLSFFGRRSLIEDMINQLRSTDEFASDAMIAAGRGCCTFLHAHSSLFGRRR